MVTGWKRIIRHTKKTCIFARMNSFGQNSNYNGVEWLFEHNLFLVIMASHTDSVLHTPLLLVRRPTSSCFQVSFQDFER